MREILFRGKRVDNDEWVCGYLSFIYIDAPNKASIYDPTIPRRYDVLSETVGQFTGLKDKNGKKIFEGDFVRCKKYIGGNFVDYHIEYGYVEFLHGAFGLHRENGYYRPFKDWLEDFEYEVVGNIYDNGGWFDAASKDV